MKPLSLKTYLLMVMMLSCVTMEAQTRVVEKVSMTVRDLKQSVDFYTTVLDFKKTREWNMDIKMTANLFGLEGDSTSAKIALLQLGNEQIELIEFIHEADARPVPSDSRSNDLWFQHIAIVVADMDEAYSVLEKNNVKHISSFPQTLPKSIPNAAGIAAFYFLDPDHHVLELISFPKGKGDQKWQALKKKRNQDGGSSVFLGIDHTAIAVEDTESGYCVWRERLGLEVAGHSLNFGMEQEHLNQVFGAKVYITGLRAAAGLGVEFLDYIAPPGGLPFPEDSKPTDLWHWHTTLVVDNVEKTLAAFDHDSFAFISREITPLDEQTKGFIVRDKDGHAILLIGKNPALP
jgi:catechol 2,3-dioxygenase-like lactoylglutathione lyase family enzyme